MTPGCIRHTPSVGLDLTVVTHAKTQTGSGLCCPLTAFLQGLYYLPQVPLTKSCPSEGSWQRLLSIPSGPSRHMFVLLYHLRGGRCEPCKDVEGKVGQGWTGLFSSAHPVSGQKQCSASGIRDAVKLTLVKGPSDTGRRWLGMSSPTSCAAFRDN